MAWKIKGPGARVCRVFWNHLLALPLGILSKQGALASRAEITQGDDTGGPCRPLPFCEREVQVGVGTDTGHLQTHSRAKTTRAATLVWRSSREISIFSGTRTLTEEKILELMPSETLPLDSAFPILVVRSVGRHGRIPRKRGAQGPRH